VARGGFAIIVFHRDSMAIFRKKSGDAGRVFGDAHFKVVNASLLDSQNEATLGKNQNSGST